MSDYSRPLKHPLSRLLMRWLVSTLGLWLAALIVGDKIDYNGNVSVLIIAGFVLAVINTIVRPILIIFTLPAILFTLGLFIIIINGLSVYLTSKLYPPLHVEDFWVAIFAGIIVGLVNYLVTAILEEIRQ
jgi:putative membrane protein